MHYALLSLLAGLIFGLGLAFSQMTNPTVVLGFLDIFGDWNPSLLIVMASAIAVGMVGYAIKNNQHKPLVAEKWQIPTLRRIDQKLIIGSGLFGIGWGLSGYCPGPGLTALINHPTEGIYFVAALIFRQYYLPFNKHKLVASLSLLYRLKKAEKKLDAKPLRP